MCELSYVNENEIDFVQKKIHYFATFLKFIAHCYSYKSVFKNFIKKSILNLGKLTNFKSDCRDFC